MERLRVNHSIFEIQLVDSFCSKENVKLYPRPWSFKKIRGESVVIMMNPNLNGLSVQQARLEAVLMKMRDLVPFVEDRDCDQVLKVLRDVVNAAIRRKDDPKKATFKDMPITDLLGLNDKKGEFELANSFPI